MPHQASNPLTAVPGPERTTRGYLQAIGVADLPPAVCPFDPGYDLGTLVGHLEQSGHLMTRLKISMACWLVAAESVTRAKVRAATDRGVATVSGGGPFEVAAAQGRLPEFLDLCAEIGFTRVEAGEGFAGAAVQPPQVLALASARGLQVQYELGAKHDGPFDTASLDALIRTGNAWLDAGAEELVVEAREHAVGVGLFDADGQCQFDLADRLVAAFDLSRLVFEAPDKPSQFALLDHFGPAVQLSNVRLEEILRVEIYRRGLHSDAFSKPNLRPATPAQLVAASAPSSTSG